MFLPMIQSLGHNLPHTHIKKKLAFAHGQTIKIYSTKTGAEKFSMSTNDPSKIVASLTFNPSDDTIFACYKNSCIIERYNYKNNTSHNSIFTYGKSYAPTIAFSPTEKRLCIAPNPGSISIRSFDNYPAEFFSGEKTYHSFCEYSQDGSTIAFGNANNVYILDTHSRECTQLHTSELITHITFYPNSSILATLSLPYSKVCFWDTTTFLPIISALTPYYTKVKAALKQDFSFSPDGKKLIIALADKCVILPVPFEVIRHCDAKEKI